MKKLNLLISTASILAILNCSNSVSSPYCNTYIDSGVSSTFSQNFTCAQVSVDGTNHVFKSSNLPNYKSYYYGSSSDLYESLPSGNKSAGNNQISSQNMKYSIPTTGTLRTSGALDGTQAGLVSIGITTNGLAIFNNAANAPDVLYTESFTFDNYAGHPQNSGIYHYHATPTKLTSDDANLIGVALDGFLIYGKKCNSGSGSDFALTQPTAAASGTVAADTGAGNGDGATSLDKLHGHTATTKHLTTATYHYHLADDPKARTDATGAGYTVTSFYTILSSYFRGVKGSVSN
ncbi:MAG: YHYH protein [Turneriella sp.]|nr:YHYH protein [Turneriella sp.]